MQKGVFFAKRKELEKIIQQSVFAALSINEQRIIDLLLDKEMHIDAIVEGLE